MTFQPLDLAAFAGFLLLVVGVSLYASRGRRDAAGYFLAGRNLPWWLIGFSLIASNISTEHFVGMAGRGYDLGLAIASYEWMAAVTLVLVGLFFLPRFLAAGIYTIPEYLEFRYDVRTRTLMAGFILAAYVLVALATVLYSGALALESIFGLDTGTGIWLIGILAGGYTIYGGLKAVVWSDLIQGVALLLGAVLVTVLGFRAIGGIGPFLEAADGKLHTVLPFNHPEMPWLAVFIGGLWIPNIFYWGLNQFITQRTLAARSLADGQRGLFLAGFIKLFIPFIIIFPGIMAAELFADQVTNPDQAYPVMMRELLPAGLTGIMFAALFGAVMSSLDSMLNSAATIFSVDLYKRHLRPEASSRRLMVVGRVTTGVLVVVACLWAPVVARGAERVRVHPDVLGVHLAGDRGRVPVRHLRVAHAAGRRLRRDGARCPGLRPPAVVAAGGRVPAPHGDHVPGDRCLHGGRVEGPPARGPAASAARRGRRGPDARSARRVLGRWRDRGCGRPLHHLLVNPLLARRGSVVAAT